jgi:hypothetical protein
MVEVLLPYGESCGQRQAYGLSLANATLWGRMPVVLGYERGGPDSG